VNPVYLLFFYPALVCLLCSRVAAAAPPEIPPPDVEAPAWVLMDHDSGQVIEVIKSGYTLGDRVLRPALVRVAR